MASLKDLIVMGPARFLDKLYGNLEGNATSADKLKTARSINGTNFDGTSTITTANWGTARNIYIQDSDGSNTGAAVSVNGGANATLKLPATIKATLSGNASSANWLNANSSLTYGVNGFQYFNLNGTAGTSPSANNTPTSAWYHIMRLNHANNSGYYADIAIPLNDVGGVWWRQIRRGTNYGWYKILDSNNYTSYTVTKTGSGASGTWGISISGNAATATKLATARTINGTSFDGSGNITTANWGTTRNITIGATTKSVNGSTNYSWSPYEMRVTRAQYGVDTSMNVIADNGCELGMASLSSSNTTINPGGGTGWHHYINMTWTDCADNNGTTTNEWCTQIANRVGSTDLWVRSRSGGSISDGTAWTAPWTRIVTGSNFTTVLNGTYVNVTGDTMTGALNFANGTWNTMGDDAYIGDYNQAGMIGIKGKNGATGIYFAPYSGSTAQTITINGSGTMTISGTVASTFSGNLSGNASTATQLVTARTINGTSFNGTGNITTSYWGTARNLTIGNTTRSVNGSANVSWPNPLKIAYYGSDAANSNGWYKVGTWSQSGYSDMNLNLLVTSGYGRRAMGIIYLAVRCDNNTVNNCAALKWLCRYGFNIGDFYFKDHGNNTWSLYVQQAVAQYGRIQIQVLSETSTSAGQHNLTFNSNSTKESAAPTGGTVSTDGNFIYSSTEPSGRYEGMVWLKPTS